MERRLKVRKYSKNNDPGPTTYETRASYFKMSSTTKKTLETKFSKAERMTFTLEEAKSKKNNPAVGKYDPKEATVYRPMRKF